jgi:hypothetical protein
MAKVKGPLFSMEASGAYGDALVFGRRKGANVVRQLVTPANPQTAGQMASRNRVSALGEIQRVINNTALIEDGESTTKKVQLTAAAPAEQTWNSYIVQACVGTGGLRWTAAAAAWTALAAGEQTAWETAAGNFDPAFQDVAQLAEGGVATTPLSKGQVFFHMQYGLNAVGLGAAPGATATVYA